MRSTVVLRCGIMFCVVLASLVIVACSSTPKLDQAILGKWEADLGGLSGLGDITESLEFYEDGTATSRTRMTDYVGNWKVISEDTIRIDWKEQGIFGHSPIEVVKVSFEKSDIMTLTSDGDSNAVRYMRPEAKARVLAETATADAQALAQKGTAEASQAQGITAPGVATEILGTWRATNLRSDTWWQYEFTFDQYGTVTLVNYEQQNPEKYWSAEGKDGQKGKYFIVSDNIIRIEVDGPWIPTPGGNSEDAYRLKFTLQGNKLVIENFVQSGMTEFERIK